MQEGVNNEDDDKKQITADNEDEGVIQRNITEKKRNYSVYLG